jgi:CBS domain-containing protein
LRTANTVEETLRVEPIRSLRLTDPVRVEPGTSLADTIRAMRSRPCGCALICENRRAIGIFTERDVLNKILGSAVDYDRPIRDFMTPDPKSLRAQDTIGAAPKLMTEQSYRHIPLVDEQGQEAGMVCAHNIVEFIAEHFPAEVVNLPPRLHQVMRKPEGA